VVRQGGVRPNQNGEGAPPNAVCPQSPVWFQEPCPRVGKGRKVGPATSGRGRERKGAWQYLSEKKKGEVKRERKGKKGRRPSH